MISLRTSAALGLVAALVIAASAPAGAQNPAVGGAPASAPAPAIPKSVPPLRFTAKLPDGVVARIDGNALTQGDLIRQMLKENLSLIAQALITAKMAEIEAARAGVQITPEALDAEIAEMLTRLAPGRSVEEVTASGTYSRRDLERQAWVTRAWKELFWKERNIPEDQRNTPAQAFLLQIYMKGIVDKYKRYMRGEEPGPPEGAVACLEWTVDDRTERYVVTPEEACDFMFGLLKPRSLEQSLDTLIDNALFEREMAKKGVKVTDLEIETWGAEQNAKYQPPFGWAQICRWKGTTIDREKERYGRILAWKRVNDIVVHDEDLVAFRKEHEDYFRSRSVNVSHILIKTVDDVTGMPKGADADATAREKCDSILRLLAEGIDFDTLAERFTEDDATRPAKGKLGQPIKKWGGGYDRGFQTAAYALKAGEVSGPVKSEFGYHVIRCDKVNTNETTQINFDEPRYREWITDEYETMKMEAWLASLRAATKIEKSPLSDLLAIKDLTLSPKKQ